MFEGCRFDIQWRYGVWVIRIHDGDCRTPLHEVTDPVCGYAIAVAQNWWCDYRQKCERENEG